MIAIEQLENANQLLDEFFMGSGISESTSLSERIERVIVEMNEVRRFQLREVAEILALEDESTVKRARSYILRVLGDS